MTDINEIHLQGELDDEPEIRYSQKGTAWSIFRVKTGEKGKGCWHRCKAFGEVAELLKDFHKGDRIDVSGRMQSGSYEGKDGKKIYTYEPVIDEVNEVKEDPKTKGPSRPQKVENDDIPF